VEVAVCDGFVGNLLLKFAESFPAFLLKQLQETAGSELFAELKQYFKQKYNPEKYGGVPILGVKGISIVCHGASSPIAIANAVASAQEMCDKGINFQIAQRLSELHRFYEMNKFFLNFRKRWELRKGRIYLNPKRFFKWFSAQKTRNEN
jgi:fatty acid/phospholipid biosynthesis enzyme